MSEYAKNCELVLALVCPVGVNLDDVQSRLDSILLQYRYSTNWVHLSKLAKEQLPLNDDTDSSDEKQRLTKAMNQGNQLRDNYKRGDFFALLAIDNIHKSRLKDNEPKPLDRKVHVIRSLKHVDEVETLRQVYGPGFFLLGLSASTKSKKHYLKTIKGVPEEDLDALIERDDKEQGDFGQQTRDVFELADAFVATDSCDSLSDQLSRVISILFSNPVVPPTSAEHAMFMAYAASVRSADLSRQVGAVIVNEDGDVLSTGANDVPKFGGGLYWPTQDDKRDYIRKYDSNAQEKESIAKDVITRLFGLDISDEEVIEKLEKLKKSKLMEITEYGRAVHAEMDALLQAARNGTSVRRGTLYATTYPCHNCAKHIVAAGIKKVVYIEPYPKSHALGLHNDSICDGDEEEGKVHFEQFVGIGPRRFIDLFSMSLGSGRKLIRKTDGRLNKWEQSNAELRVPMIPLSYLDSEIIMVRELESLKGDK